MAEVQTILSNAIQAALTGQQAPKAALDSAQTQAEKSSPPTRARERRPRLLLPPVRVESAAGERVSLAPAALPPSAASGSCCASAGRSTAAAGAALPRAVHDLPDHRVLWTSLLLSDLAHPKPSFYGLGTMGIS